MAEWKVTFDDGPWAGKTVTWPLGRVWLLPFQGAYTLNENLSSATWMPWDEWEKR